MQPLASNLINPCGGISRQTRHRNYPETETNGFLPPTARSTSVAAVAEQRPHFLRAQDCRCCKSKFRAVSITARAPAQFQFVSPATAQNLPASISSAHRHGGASRRCCCKGHQPRFHRTVLPKEFPVELPISSNRDKQFV